MKTLLVKLQFKLASWLYNQGIIAPQLLEHLNGSPVRNIKILNSGEWSKQEAEQNRDNLLNELKEIPTSEESLEWVTKELNQLIDEEEVRQKLK